MNTFKITLANGSILDVIATNVTLNAGSAVFTDTTGNTAAIFTSGSYTQIIRLAPNSAS